MKLLNALIVIFCIFIVIGVTVVAFLLGDMLSTKSGCSTISPPVAGFIEANTEAAKAAKERGSYEILCPTQVCDCGDVYVDCCCPAETPTASPETSATSSATDAPTVTRAIPTVGETITPTVARTTRIPAPTNTVVHPTRSQSTPTQTPQVTDAPPSQTPTIPTATPSSTYTQAPTPTVEFTATPTRVCRTPTPEDCYQWVCHRTGNAGWKDYCCESEGCVDAHLKHGDYLGKCDA